MKARSRAPEQDDLLRPRLSDMIVMRHELLKLAALIDWEFFEREWADFFPSDKCRPSRFIIPRLPRCCLALGSRSKKIAGCHRARPRQGKAGAARLACRPHGLREGWQHRHVFLVSVCQ
jgi:hypothetical protein